MYAANSIDFNTRHQVTCDIVVDNADKFIGEMIEDAPVVRAIKAVVTRDDYNGGYIIELDGIRAKHRRAKSLKNAWGVAHRMIGAWRDNHPGW